MSHEFDVIIIGGGPSAQHCAGVDGVAAGATEVLADEVAQNAKQQLSAAPVVV